MEGREKDAIKVLDVGFTEDKETRACNIRSWWLAVRRKVQQSHL